MRKSINTKTEEAGDSARGAAFKREPKGSKLFYYERVLLQRGPNSIIERVECKKGWWEAFHEKYLKAKSESLSSFLLDESSSNFGQPPVDERDEKRQLQLKKKKDCLPHITSQDRPMSQRSLPNSELSIKNTSHKKCPTSTQRRFIYAFILVDKWRKENL